MRQRDGERRMEMEVEMGVRKQMQVGKRQRWERREYLQVPGGDSGVIQSLLEENLMKGPFTEI